MNKIAWLRTVAGVAASFAVIGLLVVIQMRVDADPGEDSEGSDQPAHLPGAALPLQLITPHDPSNPVILEIDISADEEFRSLFDGAWKQTVVEIIAEANRLLQDVGVEIQPASIQEWVSEAELDRLPALLDSAEAQSRREQRRLFLAIACQDAVEGDGLARAGSSSAIVQFYHDRMDRNGALVAHEVAHLLGARDHEDEPECIDDGCIMDGAGFRNASSWCEHHARVIADAAVAT